MMMTCFYVIFVMVTNALVLILYGLPVTGAKHLSSIFIGVAQSVKKKNSAFFVARRSAPVTLTNARKTLLVLRS